MLYQPMLDILPKGFKEFTVPEEMDQAFCVLAQKVHVSIREIIIRYNFSVKKLKLESLKFSSFVQ